MSFKEHLEQLKTARKAGLLSEDEFRRAKATLFKEMKTGVIEPDAVPIESAVVEAPPPAVDSPRVDLVGEEEPDLNFKGRLEQLKMARKAGFLSEEDFRDAKAILFKELKTGVVSTPVHEAAHPPEPVQRDAEPAPARTLWLDEDKPARSNPWLLVVGCALFGLAGGAIYLGWPGGEESPAMAVETAEPAPAPEALANPRGKSTEDARALQRRAAQRAGTLPVFQDTLTSGGLGPEMVVIPSGAFIMGAPPTENGEEDERRHSVALPQAFALSQYPVTFQDYALFARATRRDLPADQGWGRGQRPVINVSWDEAVAYADWLTQQTGQFYRLPTEAEWEYAARAGTTTPFHFGATIATDQANYDGRFVYADGAPGQYRGQTFPVGQFPANAWGLHDVHGNVWNWTCSLYDATYGGAEQRCATPQERDPRAVRGGSWANEPKDLRAAARFRLNPELRLNLVGFRVARRLQSLNPEGDPLAH